MKILEILREYDEAVEDDDLKHDIPKVEIPHRSSKRYSIEDIRRSVSYKHGKLGSGAQATAHPHPNDPTKIVKYVKVDTRDPARDSHVQYINMVSKHRNNPFFPRIYNAKTLHHEDADEITLVVVMEKLHPVASAWETDEKLEYSVSQMMRRLGIKVDEPISNPFALDSFMSNQGNRKQLRDSTDNPQFKEALELMEPFFRKHGTDLHNENFMVRLTGHGPQLVFADPISPTE